MFESSKENIQQIRSDMRFKRITTSFNSMMKSTRKYKLYKQGDRERDIKNKKRQQESDEETETNRKNKWK